MNSINKEIADAIGAVLTLEEIFAFEGQLDNSKNDKERKVKIEKSKATLEEIAKKKGITVEQLIQKVIAVLKKTYGIK